MASAGKRNEAKTQPTPWHLEAGLQPWPKLCFADMPKHRLYEDSNLKLVWNTSSGIGDTSRKQEEPIKYTHTTQGNDSDRAEAAILQKFLARLHAPVLTLTLEIRDSLCKAARCLCLMAS
jgi:hypothetical protein